MDDRVELISKFYNRVNEDQRLIKSRNGQLEYASTMHYIKKYLKPNASILEIGAGTGRYAITLAKEGYKVTAVELVEKNIEILKSNSIGIESINAIQGDATDLNMISDESYDMTLVLGPLYHLYDAHEVDKAIDEAIRVTKKDGIIMFAFISVFGIMVNHYYYGDWKFGVEENFTQDYKTRHFKDQLFTGYQIDEFENLFKNKSTTWLTTAGMDGYMEALERRKEFNFSDEDFESFIKWHLNFAEKRELLGSNNHLLYICKK